MWPIAKREASPAATGTSATLRALLALSLAPGTGSSRDGTPRALSGCGVDVRLKVASFPSPESLDELGSVSAARCHCVRNQSGECAGPTSHIQLAASRLRARSSRMRNAHRARKLAPLASTDGDSCRLVRAGMIRPVSRPRTGVAVAVAVPAVLAVVRSDGEVTIAVTCHAFANPAAPQLRRSPCLA